MTALGKSFKTISLSSRSSERIHRKLFRFTGERPDPGVDYQKHGQSKEGLSREITKLLKQQVLPPPLFFCPSALLMFFDETSTTKLIDQIKFAGLGWIVAIGYGLLVWLFLISFTLRMK